MAANNTKKRGRERPTADSELFAIYEDLASENDDVRIQGAANLNRRFQNHRTVETLDPVLKRLIKGTCSSRKGARLGFSIALTEFLRRHVMETQTLTAFHIIGMTEQLTQPPADAAGQEARDYYIGRLFVVDAIALSGMLYTADDDDAVKWGKMLEIVVALAKKKPWLREQCFWVLYKAMGKMGSPKYNFNKAFATLQSFVDNSLINTPEGVALWLCIAKFHLGDELPKNVFVRDDPLAPENRKLLVRIMKEDTSKGDDETAEIMSQRGSWSSAPNFAWGIIITAILASEYKEQFPQYWRELVDEGMFAASSSPERKLSGFSLFAGVVEDLKASYVPTLLCRNILVNMNQQLFSKRGYLHKSASKALEALLARAQKNPEIIQPIMRNIFADDAIMKLALNANLRIKFTEKFVSCADIDHLEGVLETIMSPLVEGTLVSKRTPMLDNLLTMIVTRIKSLPYPNSPEQGLKSVRKAYRSLLRSLAESAYFVKGASADDEKADDAEGASDGTEFFKSQLSNALANLLNKDPDPSYYYIQTAKLLGELSESTGNSTLDDQVQAQVDKARKRAAKLVKAKDDASPHQKALALLFALCVIQIYNGDADALEALEDLHECYASITTTDEADEQAKAADAIIEVLLSFTSKPATMFKNLAQKAFAMCTDMVTSDGLQSMFDIFKSKEDISGQNEMFDQRDDDASEDDDIGGADDSDVEMVDADEENSNDAAEAESEESDNAEDDESSDEHESDEEGSDGSGSEASDDEELMAFDAKLAEALGTRRADTDLAHDEDESSESDMDDDQMEALDQHIATMFKQRKQLENKTKKKEQKEAKENMVIFKTRVLELVKIFITKQPNNPLTIKLVLPLVELVKETHSAKVRSEAIDLLSNLFKRTKLVKKDVGPDKQAKKEAKLLLGEVHELVASKRSKPLQTACSRASLLLAKIFLANGGDVKDVVKLYKKTAERVSNRPARFKDDFLEAWESWYTSAKNDLEK